jgi:hypothetical protein
MENRIEMSKNENAKPFRKMKNAFYIKFLVFLARFLKKIIHVIGVH